MDPQEYVVDIHMQFTRHVMAKNSDYALQKAKHVIDMLTPGQLLETATDISVSAVSAVPTDVATRRLHGTRDTNWPKTVSDADKARADREAAQHSLRDQDWR